MDRQRQIPDASVPQQRQAVLWMIAILLAIIATILLVRPPQSLVVSPAYGDQPMVGARGVFAFTGQIDKNRYGLFMMDVDSSNVWCYEYLPGTRKLKLVTARSFRYDRYLEDYNNDDPTPSMVQEMLKDQNRIQERISGDTTAPEKSKDDQALDPNLPGMPP